MRKWKPVSALAVLTLTAYTLTGCVSLDGSPLDTSADYSVNISVPYSTTTPLPEFLNVPEQVVIDVNGNVTVNDTSILNSTNTQTDYDDSAYTTLSIGDTNSQVMALQERLKALGYFTSGVSGIYDSDTETAVKRFEQTYGVMQTGIATPAFQARLFAEDAIVYGSDAYDAAVVSQYTTLQRGAVGSSVYALQHRLKELGYPIKDLTGVYDEDTEAAVQLFTEAYGLQSQKIAYIALQKELYSDSAIPYTESGAAVANTSTSLSQGNVGTQVMRMQTRLIQLGYLTGTSTGVFDAETEAAVRMFEAACGRMETGVLDETLQNLLLSDAAPSYGQTLDTNVKVYTDLLQGATGDDVVSLQARLIELGYASGAPNGVYGAETSDALVIFQHYNGLAETGIATGSVQSFLYSDQALTYADVLAGATPAVTATPSPAPATPEPEVAVETDTKPALTPEPEVEDASGLRDLAPGDEGEDVRALQERLRELGYDCKRTGEYTDNTASAVSAFQSAVGVSPTGNASVALQKYAYSKAAPSSQYQMYNSVQSFTTLRFGDIGGAVSRLQQMLWTLGYLTTENIETIGGTYESVTKAAVNSAQLAMGYEYPDGIAGEEFQCFIFSDYNKFIRK